MDAEPALFDLELSMVVKDQRTPLLSAASVLHRRGVDVVNARLSRSSPQRCMFSATFRASPGQARTVLRTFENLVDITAAALTVVDDETVRP